MATLSCGLLLMKSSAARYRVLTPTVPTAPAHHPAPLFVRLSPHEPVSVSYSAVPAPRSGSEPTQDLLNGSKPEPVSARPPWEPTHPIVGVSVWSRLSGKWGVGEGDQRSQRAVGRKRKGRPPRVPSRSGAPEASQFPGVKSPPRRERTRAFLARADLITGESRPKNWESGPSRVLHYVCRRASSGGGTGKSGGGKPAFLQEASRALPLRLRSPWALAGPRSSLFAPAVFASR